MSKIDELLALAPKTHLTPIDRAAAALDEMDPQLEPYEAAKTVLICALDRDELMQIIHTRNCGIKFDDGTCFCGYDDSFYEVEADMIIDHLLGGDDA